MGGRVSECASMEPRDIHQPSATALRRLLHLTLSRTRLHGHHHRVGQRRVQDLGRNHRLLQPPRWAITAPPRRGGMALSLYIKGDERKD